MATTPGKKGRARKFHLSASVCVDRGNGQKLRVHSLGAAGETAQRLRAEHPCTPPWRPLRRVFPIEVPPLRERREDLPALAWHFITRSARRLNLRAPRLTPAALDALTTYDWPGNVREHQHVLERAVILGRGKSLELGELLPRTESSSKPTASPAPDEPLHEARLELGERALACGRLLGDGPRQHGGQLASVTIEVPLGDGAQGRRARCSGRLLL